MTVILGWSKAMQEFRLRLEQDAPKGLLPLLIGDPGVGKRAMAAAWRARADPDDQIRIVDLDDLRGELPDRCIGLTCRRPPLDQSCFLLGEGRPGRLPVRSRTGRLPEELWARFPYACFVPALKDRRIDILSFLDCWRLKAAVRNTFSDIATQLLLQVLFWYDWPGNLTELGVYLDTLAGLGPGGVGNPWAPPNDPGLLSERPEISRLRFNGRPLDPENPWTRRTIDADRLPLDQLGDLAVRMFRHECVNKIQLNGRTIIRSGGPQEGEDEPLLAIREEPPKPGLDVAAFRAISATDFLRREVDLLSLLQRKLSPGALAMLPVLLRDLDFLGAGFASLQDGLAVDPAKVSLRAPVAAAATPGSTVPQRTCRFAIEGSNFVIEFDHKRGVYPRKGFTGLAHLRKILMQGGTPISGHDLIHEHAKAQGSETLLQATEMNAREPQSDLAKIGQQLREKLQERDDAQAVEDIEIYNKANVIISNLEKKLRNCKKMNNEKYKKATDRVRKSLGAALSRVRTDLPEFVNFVESRIKKPNDGSFVYLADSSVVLRFD